MKHINKKIDVELTDVVDEYSAERLAHRKFGVDEIWKKYDLSSIFKDHLSPGVAQFIEALPFFFIATTNQAGECDCSFRGREFDSEGKPYALLKICNEKKFIFPDFSGNNVFNSLGNILQTGQIGMLFIDFERRLRLRINGRARVVENPDMYQEMWPTAKRAVAVDIVQVFGNCRARIPQWQPVSSM